MNYEGIIQVIKERGNLPIGEIALSKYPTLSRLVNKYSYKQVWDLIKEMILLKINELNVGKHMTAYQIESCAEKLLGDYHQYKLDDFYKCLDNGITGHYGQLFDRIDVSVIFGWFRAYDKERDEAIINKRSEEASKNKIAEIPMALEGIKIPEFKSENHTDTLIEENPYQEFIKDFDNLQALTSKGKKFVLFEGKEMDFNEYLQCRIENNGDKITD